MFTTGISKNTQAALAKISKVPFVKNYYLAGGTALAVHFGHRLSYDLDFFSLTPSLTRIIMAQLKDAGKLELFQNDEGTFNGALDGVKLSFFIYPYPLLQPARTFNNVKIAPIEDIACMKLDAISSRGTKRDFIDLYIVCNRYKPLHELLRLFEKKYSSVKYNMLHVLKSLVYFEDAKDNVMPDMLETVLWEDVQQFFEKEVMKMSMSLFQKVKKSL